MPTMKLTVQIAVVSVATGLFLAFLRNRGMLPAFLA